MHVGFGRVCLLGREETWNSVWWWRAVISESEYGMDSSVVGEGARNGALRVGKLRGKGNEHMIVRVLGQ